jgi:DNA invertase Pin-like site-specific DNA recombinase
MKRAALYMRVSTKNHSQTTETQTLTLREYAAHRGFVIVEEYRDDGISGSKDSRPALSHLLRALDEFSHLGVDFISLSESIDTSTPVGKMIFTVLGAVAELERNLIKERVQMGISRARKQGNALGRPRVEVDPHQVAGLRARGLSWNQIAEHLGIGRGTAERAFKALSQKPLQQPTTAGHIS